MRYRNLVIRNAYSVVKDYYMAEDICQDTFVRFADYVNRVPEEKVKAWLLIVSKRMALDYLKRGKKHKEDVSLEISREFIENPYPDLSAVLEDKEAYEQTGYVLESLKLKKPQWYDVLILSFVEEMDNRSIASRMGIKPSLVSQWKGRAKKWLRKEYKKNEIQV